jgi:hypothetical protein
MTETLSEAVTPSDRDSWVFPIDVEHNGIRLALPLITIGGGILIYLVLTQVLAALSPDGSVSCAAVIISLIGALGVAALADRVLKQIWPSGRTLTVNLAGLHLADKRKGRDVAVRLAWDQRINVLAWRFTVKRGSARVQKGWIMLGCQLVQDDEQLTLYAFVPSKVADEARFAEFTQLVLRDVLEKGSLPLREANEQRRLLKAESERWQDGAELRREDFEKLVELLTERVSTWRQP